MTKEEKRVIRAAMALRKTEGWFSLSSAVSRKYFALLDACAALSKRRRKQ